MFLCFMLGLTEYLISGYIYEYIRGHMIYITWFIFINSSFIAYNLISSSFIAFLLLGHTSSVPYNRKLRGVL